MAGAGSIDGIVSGMNTTSIIDAIMKVEHRQVDLYEARQAEYIQKLTAWQTVNTYLLAFKAQADVLSQSTIWNSKSVASSDDTKIVAASTGSSATGTYFLSVDQLAQNQQIASQGFSESSAIVGAGTVDIRVGSGATTTITLDAGANSLEALKNAINEANAGVTAAIINDGSLNNPYRLILSSNNPGLANQISVTTNLSGGTAPNFVTKYFDSPEKTNWSSNATSSPALWSGSTYTGTTNKTYTFTVQGSGAQTVGSGPISINWSDGANSGTVTVNTAGEQITLAGAGSDGLSLSFSAGALVAGNKFQIQAMAPNIQAAQDAILRLGSGGSGGSPIIVSSSTNKITSLIDGVTLDLKSITTTPVKISVDADYSSISGTVSQFVQKYNDFAEFIEKQSSFDSKTGKAGVLLGESSLINVVSDVRRAVAERIPGLTGTLTKLSDVGIKFNLRGRLEVNSSLLMQKLAESPEEVRKLFLASGSSNNSNISYISSGAKTVASLSGYDVDITTAATQGALTAVSIANPSVSNLVLNATNNNIKIRVNNTVSGVIALSPGTYTSGTDLAHEIETQINADQSLGANDVKVTWVDSGATGHLLITSALWGSNSKVELDTEPSASASAILGLSGSTATTGVDVAGTINGEAATGVGQILSGKDTNEKTAGLKLKITLTSNMLVDGPEGKFTLTRGYASVIGGKLNSYTDPTTGILNSRARSLEKQISNFKTQIDRLEKLLEIRREELYKKYIAMEEAIGNLQTQQSAITAMFGNASSNTKSMTKKS